MSNLVYKVKELPFRLLWKRMMPWEISEEVVDEVRLQNDIVELFPGMCR